MNSADIKQKYNNASTGLFKDNSSGDIGANDARALVVDMADGFVNFETDGEKFIRQGSTTGTDTYAVTVSSPNTVFTNRNLFLLSFTIASTGAVTVNPNSAGAKKVYVNASTQAGAGDIGIGDYLLRYDTTLDSGLGGFLMISGGGGSGSGDVVGPASSVINSIAFYNDTTGKVLQAPGITLDSGVLEDGTDTNIPTKGAVTEAVRRTRTVTTSDVNTQQDDNSFIIFDSPTPIDFTLIELTAATKISFVNIGAGVVTFVNGGVITEGNLTLPAAVGTSYPTAVVIYHTSTSTRSIVGGAGGGSGDVSGPASSQDSAIALFDGISGKVIKDSTITIDDGPLEGGAGYNVPTKDAVLNYISTNTDLTDFVTLTDAAPVEVDCNSVKEPKFYLETGSSRTFNLTELRANNTLNAYITVLFCIKKTVAGDITITFDSDYNNIDLSTDAALPAITLSGADEKRFWLTAVIRGLASGCDIAWNLVTTAGGGAGSGDVVGPAAATDAVPVLFDGTTGKLVKNSTPTGSGNPVLATSPTLVTPALGTPSALVLTNATGLVTAGINASQVTLAKIANAAANSKLLGSGASGLGAAYVEITLGTNLSMSGTTLNASGGGGGGSGDVVGPASATDGYIALFDGTTGKLIKNSTLAGVLDLLGINPISVAVTLSSTTITLDCNTKYSRKWHTTTAHSANFTLTKTNKTVIEYGHYLFLVTGTVVIQLDSDDRMPDDAPGWNYAAKTLTITSGGTGLGYSLGFTRMSNSTNFLVTLSTKATI